MPVCAVGEEFRGIWALDQGPTHALWCENVSAVAVHCPEARVDVWLLIWAGARAQPLEAFFDGASLMLYDGTKLMEVHALSARGIAV